MSATTYAGIDYGAGTGANTDKATGIRYGVIGQDTVGQAWYDSAEADYGPATCGHCGNDAVDYVAEKHGEYESAKYECDDYACETCEKSFGSESAYGDEPQGYTYDGEGYNLHACFDNTQIFVTRSPYYTHAQYCSPCAPGAGNLDSPCEDGPRTYALGHDWFEDGQVPYPVYAVATGKLVPAPVTA